MYQTGKHLLLKYVTADGAIDILTNLRLKVTQVCKLDDDEEMQYGFEIAFTDSDFFKAFKNETYRLIYSRKEIPIKPSLMADQVKDWRIKRHELPKGMFDDNEQMVKETHRKNFKILKEEWEENKKHLFVLSLTESFDNKRMWEEYANKNAGAVIGFSGSLLSTFPSLSNYYGRVKYTDDILYFITLDKWVLFCSDREAVDLNAHFKKCVLRKKTKWAHQKEWRYVKADSLNQLPTEHVYEPVQLKYIEAVYIGHLMKDCDKEKIIELAKGINACVFLSTGKDSSGGMDFTSL